MYGVITLHLLPYIPYSVSNLSETVHHHPALGRSSIVAEVSTNNDGKLTDAHNIFLLPTILSHFSLTHYFIRQFLIKSHYVKQQMAFIFGFKNCMDY